jgi:hypothetical protein
MINDIERRPMLRSLRAYVRALKHDGNRFDSDQEDGALPLPLAGEGWGGGASTQRTARVEKAPPGASRRPLPQAGEVTPAADLDLTKILLYPAAAFTVIGETS